MLNPILNNKHFPNACNNVIYEPFAAAILNYVPFLRPFASIMQHFAWIQIKCARFEYFPDRSWRSTAIKENRNWGERNLYDGSLSRTVLLQDV